ncbi:MAG: Gfo/Idh/MocA family oxidoreductase [Hespellia sp.]|nr:Gfo/Idh/MocA family oxidoreductase [Hespellia sp.]
MIRIGVIGGGVIVRRRHLPEIVENAYAEVGAVCDVVKEKAEELAEEYGCSAYTDYKDLIQDDSLDAVIVAGPNRFHAQMTVDALNAGKHVMCEKPMATSLEDAEAMIEAAKKNGKKLFIAQNQRLEAPHVKAKELIASGALGKVITFKSTFGHPGCERWAAEKQNTWFFKKDVSYYGCLGDLGIHKIDVVRWILGEEFTEVFAKVGTLNKVYEDGTPIDVEDNAVMLLTTASGVMGTITVSWTYEKEDARTIFYCENGVMTINGDPDYQIVIERFDGTADYLKLGAVSNNTVQVKTGIVDEFVDCLVNDVEPSIGGRDGLEPLKVVFSAYRSSEERRAVEIQHK